MTKAQAAASTPVKRAKPDLATLLPFAVFLVIYALTPRMADQQALTLLIYIGINALVALGLNLLMGYAGQISLGHAAFFGLGAYTSAILAVKPIQAEVIPGFSVGFGILCGLAALMGFTRTSGWKLGVGLGAMLAPAWIVGGLGGGPMVSLIASAVGVAVLGAASRLGWLKSAAAGVVGILAGWICESFLAGVLARGSASPWTAMLAGVLITGVIAYLIGARVLRLKGHYLAMATLGFGIIVEIIFRQWTAVTGGSSDGIFGIPTIAFVDGLPGPLRAFFQFLGGGALDARQQYFYLVWGFVLVALVLAVNIVRSRVGRAFRAVHGSEVAAESLGVDTERYKVQVFVLSAAMGSVAGSLYAHNAGIGYVSPSEFSFMVSVQLVVMVVVGGMASVWGALFGAAAIQMLKNRILDLSTAHPTVFGLSLKGLDPIVFGAILIVVMIVLPQGLVRGLTDMVAVAVRNTVRRERRASAE